MNTTKKLTLRRMLFAFALTTSLSYAAADSIRVATVKLTDAVSKKASENQSIDKLKLLADSLDGQLIHNLNSSRKFSIVSKSHLDVIEEEQIFAQSPLIDSTDEDRAQIGKLKANKYVLLVEINNYEDAVQTAKFKNLNKSVAKRKLHIVATGQIYNTTTAKLLESTNFHLSRTQTSESISSISKNPIIADELISDMAMELAEKIVRRVVDVIYPAKIIAVKPEKITINRGDTSGIKMGEIWDVYEPGEELIDPDTGESLGQEESQIGSVEIIAIMPKFSKGKILNGQDMQKGYILRRREKIHLPRGITGVAH